MKDLEVFYRRWLKFSVVIIVSLTIAYRIKLEPWLTGYLIDSVRWIVTAVGSVLPGALFLGSEWLIRNRLWRILKPEFDLSGDWEGESEYSVVQVKRESHPGQQPIQVPFVKSHKAYIIQDCFSVAIAPTREGYHKWNSIVMTFRPPEVEYAYTVTYLA
ncbi:MAG: hypothetical protein ACREMY_33020, partial [bacterium]